MKKSLIIFFVSSLIFPSLVHSAWFKLFSTQTADLYLDTSSIKREKTSIFFSQLVNYKVKQKNGMLSLKTISEIMGKGKNFYTGKPKRNWRRTKKGTSVYFLNEILCDRVLN